MKIIWSLVSILILTSLMLAGCTARVRHLLPPSPCFGDGGELAVGIAAHQDEPR